jgi:hypothetical protein
MGAGKGERFAHRRIYKDKEGEIENKSRGFMAGSVDLDAIEGRLELEVLRRKNARWSRFGKPC